MRPCGGKIVENVDRFHERQKIQTGKRNRFSKEATTTSSRVVQLTDDLISLKSRCLLKFYKVSAVKLCYVLLYEFTKHCFEYQISPLNL
jgi:hypothetical protein